MDYMKEYIEALKNGKGYDWISEKGHSLNKYELIDIIKELDYAIYDRLDKFDQKDIYNSAAEELENLYYCEEE